MAATKTTVRANNPSRRSTKLKALSKTALTVKPKARSVIISRRSNKAPECSIKKTVATTSKIQTEVISHRSTSGVSFLDLSAEIRNKIYGHLLTSPDKVRITDAKRGDFSSAAVRFGNKGRLFSSILSTCREIRNEAAPMLYGSNTFSFFSGMPFMLFMIQIGSNAEFIRHVRIEHVGEKSFVEQGVHFLKGTKVLKTLEFARSARNAFTIEESVDMLAPMMTGLASGGHEDILNVLKYTPGKATKEERQVRENAEAVSFEDGVKTFLAKRLA
jgi:hypothetical protein